MTPGFWILPLYGDLLNSARRNRPSAASERARGCTGLVKLICKENKEHVLTAVLHWTDALTFPMVRLLHLQGSESDLRHSMVFQNICHIGDTKSAQELEVFLRMSRERLRLCCGIQCTDSLPLWTAPAPEALHCSF